MKITVKSDQKVKQPEPAFPYLAVYCGDINRIVLVTGKHKTFSDFQRMGMMVNGNREYNPFEYVTDGWSLDSLKPFVGTIELSN